MPVPSRCKTATAGLEYCVPAKMGQDHHPMCRIVHDRIHLLAHAPSSQELHKYGKQQQ